MQFNSAFEIGQKVWVFDGKEPRILTIGKIIIEYTDSPGREGEEIFDNYKPQKKYVERYMCIETGIGSGSVWEFGKNIFETKAECLTGIMDEESKCTCQGFYRNPNCPVHGRYKNE